MWGLRSPSAPTTKHSNTAAETSLVNKPKDDDTAAEAFSLTWLMWGLRSPSAPPKQPSSPSRPSRAGRDHSADEYLAKGLFFHEDLVQVGKTLTLYFPVAASAPLGLLPRRVADAIPFSASSLPATLARLGIANDSAQATAMQYSSTPHHRRFVRSITNGSGGVGFMSLVIAGPSPPVRIWNRW